MTETIAVLVVDDEPSGRNILKTYLEKYIKGIKIVGLASNAQEAEVMVAEHDPELVFLDIEMPEKNGIEFLEQYSPIPFEVIFTTAYEKYAIKAFEISAIHYLLKPFKLEELRQAIDKYRKNKNLALSQQKLSSFLANVHKKEARIAVHTTDSIEILEIGNIVRCQAESNYTIFYMASGKTWTASKTLKEFEQKLLPAGFVRIHRSHLINMKFIKKLWKTRSHQIEMKDGKMLTLSSGRREEFIRRFSEEFGLDEL